ncbi:MAG: 2-oxoacid:acceptor oxidoreductase family protein [Thermodesulfobacteriota bacterium]|nr:2-oxoacid:acceptor oxidoreductase family protein [Thermodesulfobacteriota bacterium]
MLIKTIFSGFGGQGVLSMGYNLSRAGMLEGKMTTYLPSYGAEVRGGTANCTVAISDEEIASPVASSPEFIIVMNQPSFVRFQNLLQSGGVFFVNSSLVNIETTRGDIEVVEVPATQLAEELGNIKVANMVMLGAFVRKSNLVLINTLIEGLKETLGKSKPALVEINKKALNTGYNLF